ncbi:elongation factor 4 [Candidatus Nomurabacteria bacterium]|nr:elongation factor 4 [Candidatus Nomurabacteria bacterium]
MKNIRNFSIIAHIDHGKSTLADRMLEITHTIEKRKMKEQVLDDMELERERGITIKMRPVRMKYKHEGNEYILNLIDTPGHIDFYYEVSRALKAVEGSILLVDATQGVQAQTLTTLSMARDSGLKIIPVLSKIDSPIARIKDVKKEICDLLECDESEIVETSGKTGEGVEKLLNEIIKRIPPPKKEYNNDNELRARVFDFQYSNHKGVIVYVRILDGKVSRNKDLLFKIANEKFTSLDVGVFVPEEKSMESIEAGEIGYIVTGVKRPGVASVGDTITYLNKPLPALSGYMTPKPVVWASVYPESQDDFNILKIALERLKLSDSSYSFEEESSGILGRGFRCGFLGMLHLEIITERLRREFNLNLIVTTPSITYIVEDKKGKKKTIYSPTFFPEFGDVLKVEEPWVSLKIIIPNQYIGQIMQNLYIHEAVVGNTETFGENRTSINCEMSLRELMRNFFDEIKSISSGYASLSYEIEDFKNADVCRLDILVADEIVPAFSRVVSKNKVQEEAEKAVEKLYNNLPRQMFTTKIQGRALGRILSSRTLSALRKDVTQHMYGGDITRKMKLREKQKKGKKKMKERGKVNIPQDVFLKMMRTGE